MVWCYKYRNTKGKYGSTQNYADWAGVPLLAFMVSILKHDPAQSP